ncbi:cystatin-F isoform X2 [Ovis aries]|uniref:Cystatin F n=1 Tax=Ovis aries TaxID=9940 RepID=A0AC11DXL1_SHEEP|nr:cystatin-F isoform X2 [Ovis aries]
MTWLLKGARQAGTGLLTHLSAPHHTGPSLGTGQPRRHTGHAPGDFCSQILKSDVKPGFPKTIKTNNPDVLRAARHSAESFNNCSNDAFLFRESRISRALVQIVKGLKFMLDVDIGRTTCRKNGHANLDDCGFQTNRTLQWTLSCYSEVWVIPWLQTTEVSVLHCH